MNLENDIIKSILKMQKNASKDAIMAAESIYEGDRWENYTKYLLPINPL